MGRRSKSRRSKSRNLKAHEWICKGSIRQANAKMKISHIEQQQTSHWTHNILIFLFLHLSSIAKRSVVLIS